MNQRRFVKLGSERVGLGESARVLVDTKTGVQYLFYQSGYGGGLTVIVDREGKPLIARPNYE